MRTGARRLARALPYPPPGVRRDGERRIVHVVEVDCFGNAMTDGELPDRAAERLGVRAGDELELA